MVCFASNGRRSLFSQSILPCGFCADTHTPQPNSSAKLLPPPPPYQPYTQKSPYTFRGLQQVRLALTLLGGRLRMAAEFSDTGSFFFPYKYHLHPPPRPPSYSSAGVFLASADFRSSGLLAVMVVFIGIAHLCRPCVGASWPACLGG